MGAPIGRYLVSSAGFGPPSGGPGFGGMRCVQASIEEGPGVDDLIVLTHLHEPAILYTLHQRYIEDVIYTYTGPILLAINPFWRVPL